MSVTQLYTRAIDILNEIRTYVDNDSDCLRTSFSSALALRNEIDRCIEWLRVREKNKLVEVYHHFLPTATFQEHAIANGWSSRYMELASEMDELYSRMKR